jgi:hypothetical protein
MVVERIVTKTATEGEPSHSGAGSDRDLTFQGKRRKIRCKYLLPCTSHIDKLLPALSRTAQRWLPEPAAAMVTRAAPPPVTVATRSSQGDPM